MNDLEVFHRAITLFQHNINTFPPFWGITFKHGGHHHDGQESHKNEQPFCVLSWFCFHPTETTIRIKQFFHQLYNLLDQWPKTNPYHDRKHALPHKFTHDIMHQVKHYPSYSIINMLNTFMTVCFTTKQSNKQYTSSFQYNH